MNVLGMAAYVSIDSWLLDPRFADDAFDGTAIIALALKKQLLVIVVFSILNFVWYLRIRRVKYYGRSALALYIVFLCWILSIIGIRLFQLLKG